MQKRPEIITSRKNAAVASAAVFVICSAVIGYDNKQSFFHIKHFTGGVVNVPNKSVGFGYAFKMLGRSVALAVSHSVDAIKLHEKKIGMAFPDIIANYRGKFKILCGVVRNADIVFNDAVGYRIPIAIRAEDGIGIYLSYSSEYRRESGIEGIRSP